MANETKIQIDNATLEDYKKTAVKWNQQLLELPFAAAQDVLKHMRAIHGLCGSMKFPAVSATSEFGPYDPDRVSTAQVDIKYRTITTHMGSVVEKFHPNDYKLLTMGYTGATVGEAQKKTKPALLVLSQIAKARGEAIANAAFFGVRNENGTKTKDLCDGLITIAKAEITAGNISVANGNLYKMAEKFDNTNACKIAKDIVFKMNPYLRRQKCVLMCSQAFADAYNESYLLTHAAIIYNKDYNQPFVEGSNGNVTLLPLPQLDGTDTFILTPESNLLYGVDNESDASFVQVDRFEPFRLTFSSTMFLGFQYHSIDPRKLVIIDFKDAVAATAENKVYNVKVTNPEDFSSSASV